MISKKQFVLIIALVALVSLMITPVMAETLTGTLGQSGINITIHYDGYYSGYSMMPHKMWSWHIELLGRPSSFIAFTNGVYHTFDTNAPTYATTPFTLRVSNASWTKTDGQIIATGDMGYSRLFNTASPPVEITGGYIWLVFTTFNTSGLSGNQRLYLEYSDNGLYNLTYSGKSLGYSDDPSGNLLFADLNWGYAGNWYLNRDITYSADYSAISPGAGELGLTVDINKKGYSIQGIIYDVDNNIIGSDSIQTTNAFHFTALPQPIKIGVRFGTYQSNSSVLFYTIPIPPGELGYHNIIFWVKNKAGANVYNAHISFAPTTPGTVLTGHTNESGMLTFNNAPGGSAAIVDVTTTGFPEYIETFSFTSDMTKTITLGSPTINLYLDIKDSTYGYYLDDVTSGIQNVTSGTWRNSTGSGARYFDSTGASYEYPLSIGQTVNVAATKAGYRPANQTVTIPYDKYLVTLHMINLNGTAPSSGNFTAVIAAGSVTTGLEIPGASITIQELGRMASTNQGGVATFMDVPVGTYTLAASAPGYQSAISSITGTNQETVMKRIRLLPTGCSISESNVVSCDGTVINPGTGTGTGTGNQTPNEKAAAGITAFLDNFIGIGVLIFFVLLIWFFKKILFS